MYGASLSKLSFSARYQFNYSGDGMTLLQVVSEKATGKSLEQLMQEHIFGPLGVTMSSYMWQPRFEADYAVGHIADGKVYEKDKDNAARSASTLETSTDDYVRFMTAVLRRELLSESSWNEIFKLQLRIRTKTQVGPRAPETTAVNDAIELSYGIGWGLQRTPHGWGAFKEGHGAGMGELRAV
ncbi:MAG: serine hydrolase domain-containing protein [Gemmatimonadaceae bacterium]